MAEEEMVVREERMESSRRAEAREAMVEEGMEGLGLGLGLATGEGCFGVVDGGGSVEVEAGTARGTKGVAAELRKVEEGGGWPKGDEEGAGVGAKPKGEEDGCF